MQCCVVSDYIIKSVHKYSDFDKLNHMNLITSVYVLC